MGSGLGVLVGGGGSVGGGWVGGSKVGLLVGLGGITSDTSLAAVGVKVGKRVRVGRSCASSGWPMPGNEAQAKLTSMAMAMGILKRRCDGLTGNLFTSIHLDDGLTKVEFIIYRFMYQMKFNSGQTISLKMTGDNEPRPTFLRPD